MQSVMQDVRYAGRNLRRAPVMTAVVVSTLALGIGANAAMFGVLDRLLVSGPAHVDDLDRVVRVYFTRTPENGLQRTFARTNYATYTALRDSATSFQTVAAYNTFEQMLGEGPDAERIDIQQTTWTFFPLLGVEPAFGRFYDGREDTPPRGQQVAVLSHGFWTRHFGADPSVLGDRITFGEDRYTILGVAPRGFTGAELERVDVWVPVSSGMYEPRSDWTTTWNARWLTILGRLAPGVSADVAGTEATAIHRQAYDGSQDAERALVASARPLLYGDEGQEPMEAAVSRWLAGVAAIVLLIACANVASLLLARGMQRRREVVLRVALGISRGRLVRLLAAEAVVLSAAGGIAALFVAHWGGGLLQAALLPNIAWEGVASSGRLLFFTAAATLCTALVVAPFPALQGLRPRLTQTLKDGGPASSRTRAPVRYGLTTAQAALSVVLLVGAGLFVQSLARVRQLDLGIDTDLVVTAGLTWTGLSSDLPADERRAELGRRAGV
jgi:predicted permease